MIAWASITFGAYRFRRAWSAQGRSQSELLYRAPGKFDRHGGFLRTLLNIVLNSLTIYRLSIYAYIIYRPQHYHAAYPRVVFLQYVI